MLIEIQSWLRQPKVWRFVCFVSSVVGLVCYALSSSFNNLFGKWCWWKILLYIVFTFIICLAVLFPKTWQRSTSLQLEAHTAFLVLMTTSVYSFFFDKVVKGKPDAYSLVSCAGFSIMSLGLSRLSHLGFEVDLLYFFSGLLTVQLMKIKLWLIIVGGSFSYSLIKLRSTLDTLLIAGDVELQVVDQDIESGSLSSRSSASQVDSPQTIITATTNPNSRSDDPLENEDLAFQVTQVGSKPQQDNSYSGQFDPLLPSNLSNRKDDSFITERMERELEQRVSSLIELLSGEKRNAMFTSVATVIFQSVINSCTVIEKERMGKIIIARFMGRIEALKKKNRSVIGMVSKHVNEYLQANAVVDRDQIPVPQIDRDDNLVVDALRFVDDIDDLRGTARLMVMTGNEGECCRAYCSWRREFLNESLSTFGLQVEELNMEDIDKMKKIECWIKALSVAVRILFPNERRLCLYVFGNFTSSADFAFTEVCTELATRLLSTANTLAKNNSTELEELMYEFELLFSGKYTKSLPKDARRVRKSLGIFMDSENILPYGGGGLLPITHEVIDYIRANPIDLKSNLKLPLEGMVSPSVQVTRITRLFERSLKANSKNYKNPTLGYVFILNNRSYIDREADLNGLGTIGYDWLRKNKRKIEKSLQLYQRSSWTKILNFLKLDINESEPSSAAELMKDKLRSFKEHFDDTCNDQSTWYVSSGHLRKQIIEFIENILLPAYGNFLGRLQDFLGNQAYEYISYGMIDVQDRLNNLFLASE